MFFVSRAPVVPVLRLSGPIGLSTPLRQGLSLAALAGPIERAFALSKVPTVVLSINSPGGSAVQSHQIFRRIRQLADEKKKRVIAFCEDVAASGGYFIAVAGDEIHADPSSIVGSIGVISATFGLDKAIERLGVERRIYTAGEMKSFLDPFRPVDPEAVDRLRTIQGEIHDVFIGVVKERRGQRLQGTDSELFSGAFWSGAKAQDLGLVDGLSDMRSKLRELHGPKVRLRVVPMGSGGLLSRLRRPANTLAVPAGWADEVAATLETRALWARYGL